MKKFDIEEFDRTMPYEPLSDSNFEKLIQKTLSRLRREDDSELRIESSRSRWTLSLIRIAASVAVVAAAVVCGLFIANDFNYEQNGEAQSEALIAEFVSTLSNSDLEELISDAEASYEFYTNL